MGRLLLFPVLFPESFFSLLFHSLAHDYSPSPNHVLSGHDEAGCLAEVVAYSMVRGWRRECRSRGDHTGGGGRRFLHFFVSAFSRYLDRGSLLFLAWWGLQGIPSSFGWFRRLFRSRIIFFCFHVFRGGGKGRAGVVASCWIEQEPHGQSGNIKRGREGRSGTPATVLRQRHMDVLDVEGRQGT